MRAAAASKALGMTEGETIKNNKFGPGPNEKIPYTNPRYHNPVAKAEQERAKTHANTSGVYYGGAKPKPIPGVKGENRGAFTGRREGESRA